MKRGDFCKCMRVLRNFAEWERNLCQFGFDVTNTPAAELAEQMECLMRDHNDDWSYDSKLGIDWIIEWACTPDSPLFVQTRHGRTWKLEDESLLYDFLEFMNEHGWED